MKKQETSKILKDLENVLFLAWFSCVLPCIPCIGNNFTYMRRLPMLKRIVEFYGGKGKLRAVAERVRRERALFQQAVRDEAEVKPFVNMFDVSLIELVTRFNNPRLRALCPPNNGLFHIGPNQPGFCKVEFLTRETYLERLWTRFKKLGGNADVVAYGIVEGCRFFADEQIEKILADVDGVAVEMKKAGVRAGLLA